ncbi:MAG: hypothetical protein MUF32_01510 [Burkholderiaceae bacterium]|jgi:hypothetical protein|nr:hypothetical protein [Burkholderiaceae bacterium]
MQINILPAGAGINWLREGIRLFARQPIGLPAMVVLYLMMLVAPALLPIAGIAISGVLAPFASVGLLGACRDVAEGRMPTPLAFAQPFRPSAARLQMVRLGIINAILLLVVATLASLLAPELPGGETPQSLPDVPLPSLLVQLALYLPVMALMWFAPVLTGWHGVEPAKSMFGSVVACWRNVGPMLVFGVAAGVLTLGVSVIAVMLLGTLTSSRELMSIVIAPLALVLMTVVQASLYPMYRSVFVDTPRERP